MTLERILRLREAGERFAVATVVSRRKPVSAQLGDKALIFADGRFEGFIGGACSRDIVRKQALEVLAAQRARLVRISPEPLVSQAGADRDEICVPMTCASEGAVDVYIEPQLESEQVLIVGASPIAVALARQAGLQGFEVALACEAEERGSLQRELEALKPPLLDVSELSEWLGARAGLHAVIVASMGHYDEDALPAILESDPAYVGLVSSRKRGQQVKALLADRGVDEAGLARLRNPVGLDLGAKRPEEVAVSIFAEMIQLRRNDSASKAELVSPPEPEARDPVCGMSVTIAGAKHYVEVDGQSYYFCCPNCRHSFLKDPGAYLSVAG